MGRTQANSQRYLCKVCQRRYTPEPRQAGCDHGLRQRAVRLSVDGMNLRRISRTLWVNHQRVANWVNAHAAQLPAAPVPAEVETIELDELFTFVGSKNAAYVLTLVERSTSCIVGWAVTFTCDGHTWQTVLDQSPQAVLYYSDASSTYDTLIYTPGSHLALPNKSQTYRVEGDNAELRHYLARKSPCFKKTEIDET